MAFRMNFSAATLFCKINQDLLGRLKFSVLKFPHTHSDSYGVIKNLCESLDFISESPLFVLFRERVFYPISFYFLTLRIVNLIFIAH